MSLSDERASLKNLIKNVNRILYRIILNKSLALVQFWHWLSVVVLHKYRTGSSKRPAEHTTYSIYNCFCIKSQSITKGLCLADHYRSRFCVCVALLSFLLPSRAYNASLM